MPIASGNVSLYNETDGQAILPTPTIGEVGLIDHTDEIIETVVRDRHMALAIGNSTGHLGQPALLAEVFDREEGNAPPVDLEAERRHGAFILENRDYIRACTDLSDDGFTMAAFKLAEAAGVGVQLDPGDTATLFGEDQARYLIACCFHAAEWLVSQASQTGVPIVCIGKFTGDTVRFGTSEAPLAKLSALYQATMFFHSFDVYFIYDHLVTPLP